MQTVTKNQNMHITVSLYDVMKRAMIWSERGKEINKYTHTHSESETETDIEM